MLDITATGRWPGADQPPAGSGGAIWRALVALIASLALLALVTVQLGDGVERGSTVAGVEPPSTRIVAENRLDDGRSAVAADGGSPAAAPAGAPITATNPAEAGTTAPVEATTAAPPESADIGDGDSFAWRPRRAAPEVYLDPRAVAERFAADLLGFRTSTIGNYRPIDGETGLIEVRARTDGPATSVLLHHDGADGSWWVVAASSEHIAIEQPVVNGTIDDPVLVAGRAVAADGTVGLELWAMDDREPLLIREFVIRDGDEPDWFEGAFGWTNSSTARVGALVFRILDPESGTLLEGAMVPVRFPTAGR